MIFWQERLQNLSEDSPNYETALAQVRSLIEREILTFRTNEFFRSSYQDFYERQEALSDLTEGFISNLICHQQNPRIDYCEPIGNKIARSLIRIAATRIFSEPEQSILELPVNSLDAYSEGKETVGKFGLGFYSILYWLIQHPSRCLTIVSQNWAFKIKEVSGNLAYSFKQINGRVGTQIILEMFDDPVSGLSYDKFLKQIDKLRFVQDHPILVNDSLLNKSENGKPVEIVIYPGIISVKDYAGGISTDTLFNSLLIPSISTKGVSSRSYIPQIGQLRNI